MILENEKERERVRGMEKESCGRMVLLIHKQQQPLSGCGCEQIVMVVVAKMSLLVLLFTMLYKMNSFYLVDIRKSNVLQCKMFN